MKKRICAGLILILCMGVLSACSKKTDVENSTVFVDKKGRIVSVDVEDLDKDYYDAAELKEYITEHVADYVADNGETVKMASFEVEDTTAKLQMKYDSYEDYTGFNGIELYTGNVIKAQAAGYDFNTEFYSVSEEDTEVNVDEIIVNDEYKVVVIGAGIDVSVPGKVLYVSGQNMEVTSKNTVSITEESGDEEHLFYIIYK